MEVRMSLSRRALIVGVSLFIATPAIVRASNLMPIRGVIVPVVPRRWYGFCERLMVQQMYLAGELQGRALDIARENGVLRGLGLMPRGMLVGEYEPYLPRRVTGRACRGGPSDDSRGGEDDG
jgi:hypothetical protein